MALTEERVHASSPYEPDLAAPAEAYINYHLQKYEALSGGHGCSILEQTIRADYMALKTIKNGILACGETYYPAVDTCSRLVHEHIRKRLAGRAAAKLGIDPKSSQALSIDWANPDLAKELKEHMHYVYSQPALGAVAEDFPESIIAVSLGSAAVVLDTGVDDLYAFARPDPVQPEDLTGIYYLNRCEPRKIATWQVE